MKSLVLALAAAVLSTQAGGGATGFTAHEIGTGLRGGYQVVVADLNKDGKPDIIALASGVPELLWYENPGWQKHVLASGVSQLINASAHDIDGDGIPEIALAQGFTMSTETSKGQIGLLTARSRRHGTLDVQRNRRGADGPPYPVDRPRR